MTRFGPDSGRNRISSQSDSLALETLKKSNSYMLSDIGRQMSTDSVLTRQATADALAAKKPASLTEINDLYCALQELVKTNVTGTPVPLRNGQKATECITSVDAKSNNILEQEESSDISSESDMLLSDSSTGRRLSPSPSSVLADELDRIAVAIRTESKLLPRGVSSPDLIDASFIAAVENKASVSTLGRKSRMSASASDCVVQEQMEENGPEEASQDSSRKKSLGQRRSNQAPRVEQKRKRGVFSRFRSRSSPWLDKPRPVIATDTERKLSHDSNLDPTKTTSDELTKSASASSAGSSVQDIDQLCAALNLEYGSAFQVGDAARNLPFNSPENVVSRIENWYLQAAAQAAGGVAQRPSSAIVVGGNETLPEGETRRRRQSAPNPKGNRRESTINRRKQDRLAGVPRKVSLDLLETPDSPRVVVNSNSSPDLNLLGCALNDAELSEAHSELRETSLSDFPEKDVRASPKKSFRHGRKPSEEDTPNRLPRQPLFYIPDGDSVNVKLLTLKVHGKNGLTRRGSTPGGCSDKTLPLDRELFYVNPEHRGLGDGSESPRLALKDMRANPEENGAFSAFDAELPCAESYYRKQIDGDVQRTLKNACKEKQEVRRGSLNTESDIPTDKNANLCPIKSKSMYDLDSTGEVGMVSADVEPTGRAKFKSGKDKSKSGVNKLMNMLGGKR